jgi:hypothetical protein
MSTADRHLIAIHERELRVLGTCLGLPHAAIMQFVRMANGDAQAVASVASRCLHQPVDAVSLFVAAVMDPWDVKFKGDSKVRELLLAAAHGEPKDLLRLGCFLFLNRVGPKCATLLTDPESALEPLADDDSDIEDGEEANVVDLERHPGALALGHSGSVSHGPRGTSGSIDHSHRVSVDKGRSGSIDPAAQHRGSFDHSHGHASSGDHGAHRPSIDSGMPSAPPRGCGMTAPL